jgi:hypothetical protein
LIIFLSVVGHSQVTSSAMSGAVKSATGEFYRSYGRSCSQTYRNKYYSTTDSKGGYAVQGLGDQVGRKVTYVGYQTTEITEINAP